MKSGIYKTNLSGDAEYKSFYPTPLKDIKFENLSFRMSKLLSIANYELGRLNGVSSNIGNIEMFLSSYVRKEALYSSQIEGTQATLEDILDANNIDNVNADLEEVINNVKAIKYALDLSEELPICNRYIKMIHAVLMDGVRGNDKNPGEFRHSQNWIGHAGSSLKNAKYIPPNHLDMEECMSELESYINEDSNIDDLIKIALIHYQFETIHPFLDGNGRIGRLLILIYLIIKKKINNPCLYISYYLKRNQLEYYDRMSYVRIKDDYEQWIEFFLQGIIEICRESIDCINKLNILRNNNLQKIKDKDKWLLDYLEQNPIIDAKRTSERLQLEYSKVNRIILKYVDLGILKIVDNSKRNRTYSYEEYINILKDE